MVQALEPRHLTHALSSPLFSHKAVERPPCLPPSPQQKPKRRLPDTITRLPTPPLPPADLCDEEEGDASGEEDKDE
eukprot:16278-Eustigmatos_ZCMA.PRE.1